uniref:tricyclene synthase n=1 Tax=Scoparia dulcis TaxID=107240 RepID=A0A1W7HBY4_SCODU
MSCQTKIIPISNYQTGIWTSKHYSSVDSFPRKGRSIIVKCNSQSIQDSTEKIREMLSTNAKIEISPSAYDTAWVAMVPSSPGYSGGKPFFPQCLDWILENQNPDGSWGLDPGHPSLVKDSLSCTLACLLALRKWNLGQQQIHKGLDYIGTNGCAICDKDQVSPIGFDIIFPSMVNSAREMGLVMPDSIKLDTSIYNMLDPRYVSLLGNDCIASKNQILGYVAEGLGKYSCNWNELLSTQQRSNGSLFNSPATTAAALIHRHDGKCLEYLLSIQKIHKTWVPTIHPMDIYARLCMIDTLERLGIRRHFEQEIGSILDQTYRYWQQEDEEIFSDVTCLALAFRLLRMHGYEISPDKLVAFSEEESFFNTTSIQFTGIPTILELYRASEVALDEEEIILDKIQAWTSKYLKQKLLDHSISDKRLHKQVEYAMETFYGTLDRVEHRRTIELYNTNNFRMSKTAYRCPMIENPSFLSLAHIDFLMDRAQQQKELKQLQRWCTDSRLEELKRGRNILLLSHYLSSAILVGPELSDARISYSQGIVLTTFLDDFFDKYASLKELLEFVEFINKWDGAPTTGYRTKELEIHFQAIYNNANELAYKASIRQGRNVKDYLVGIWLVCAKSQLKQVDWTTNNIIPTMEEQLLNASETIACNVVILITLLFLGEKLSEELLHSEECGSLLYLASLLVRLLNDLQTFKREREGSERIINRVNFLLDRGGGAISEEEAVATVKEMIKTHTRKLLKMVVQTKGSGLSRECKNLFWNSVRIAYYLYRQSDELTNTQAKTKLDMEAVMYEPLNLSSHKLAS